MSVERKEESGPFSGERGVSGRGPEWCFTLDDGSQIRGVRIEGGVRERVVGGTGWERVSTQGSGVTLLCDTDAGSKGLGSSAGCQSATPAVWRIRDNKIAGS